MLSNDIIALEDRYLVQFAPKTPLVVDFGSGVDIWDTDGRHYIDFTGGWAVTSLGHADPIVVGALCDQAKKILHNPDAGLTYSPARAQLIAQLLRIVPEPLQKFYFVNSGAEANDSAIKLARKISGRKKVVATYKSFHGRTIGTTSVTGQAIQRDRFDVLVPHTEFIPFNDSGAAANILDKDTAAFIVEPIQGEGGIWVPDDDYLPQIAELCRKNGTFLIVDEIQTGFWRTGPVFSSLHQGVVPDFLTMAKGIAGGFPFGAVAVAESVANKIEPGDHGGTYCGNPLGCAVAAAVIEHGLAIDLERSVLHAGGICRSRLTALRQQLPHAITEVRGRGLLHALQFSSPEIAGRVKDLALDNGLIINCKHGTIVRISPALTIDGAALDEGLGILEHAVKTAIEELWPAFCEAAAGI